MARLAGYTIDDGVLRTIDGAADAAGIPRNVLRAFVLAESGGNPQARGDGGRSIGLLQLYMDGGQGTGYVPGQLFDPHTNLAIGVPHIARAWERTAGLGHGTARVERAAQLSGHPGDPSTFTPGSQPWTVATTGSRRIAEVWARLEAEQPSVSSQGASIGPVPQQAVVDVVERVATFVREHPRLAAGAAAAAMVLLS